MAAMLPVEAAQKQCSLAEGVMRHHATHHSLIHSCQRPCSYPLNLPSHSCQTLHPRYHSQQDLWTVLQCALFYGCNDTLKLLPSTWKTGNMVTLEFFQWLSL